MDIQVLRLTSTCTRYIRERCPDSMSSVFVPCRFFFFFITLSHPHYKRPPRGAKGERKKESRGLEQGKWIEGGYCGKGDYCSALSCLNPTILLSFNTFQWQPPLPILLRTHNLLSTSFLRQREICYSAWVEQVGGQGVGWGDKYGGFGGRPAIFWPQLHLFSTAWLGGPPLLRLMACCCKRNQHTAQTSIHEHYWPTSDAIHGCFPNDNLSWEQMYFSAKFSLCKWQDTL